MKYYLAPLEAVTTYVYRNAQAAVYGPLDKYFIPFLEPHEKRDFKKKELKDILPENNLGLAMVPQILTNRADGFLRLARALQEFGYQEINLNLGCPSKTVVSKGKGSGFLAFPEELDRFLDEIFSGTDLKISIKTRIGKENPEEFARLLEIYNKYPLEELIIHPRVQTDYYKHTPWMDVYREACGKSRNPLCYNGDLFTEEQIQDFREEFPQTEQVMLGRGILVNPGLVSGDSTKEKFREFHEKILQGYLEWDMGDTNVLFRMKELWFYQIHSFADADHYAKKLRKTQKLSDYQAVVEELLREREFTPPHTSSHGLHDKSVENLH